MANVFCPECDAVIKIAIPREGAQIKCPVCGVELEVVSIYPLEVDFADDGDWSDENY